ncbi:M20 peptidase family dipeptidase, partial [Rhizobium ruizarguesonis]
PKEIPDNVRHVLADCFPEAGDSDATIDPNWGEPGLTPAEQLFAWSSFAILAFDAGNPKTPVGAIPPRARARCQLRFV